MIKAINGIVIDNFFLQECINSLLKRLDNDQSSTHCHVLALQMLRLFSREKDKLVNMTSEYSLGVIMKMAGLKHYAEQTNLECVTIQDGGDQDGMYC